MSAVEELAKLDACQDKIDALNVAIGANMEIKKYNAAQDEKARIAIQTWEEKGRYRLEEQENWQEEFVRERDRLESALKVTYTKGRASYPFWCKADYGDDWEDYSVRITVPGEERRNCRMTLAAREKLATQKILDKYGNIKPPFTDPKPVPRTGDYALKDYVPLDTDIGCCPDLESLVPEESSNNYLVKTNTCVIDMGKTRENLLVKKEEQYKEKLIRDEAAQLEKDKYAISMEANAFNIMIGLILLASCLSLSGSFGMLAFMKKRE